MQVIKSFDPSAATSGQIEVGAADPGCKILLYNLSIYAILIDFENGSTALLHAGEANWWELDGSTPFLLWSQYSQLANSAAAISQITGTLYRQDEEITGTYPMSLTYQLNIGNTVQTNAMGTNTVNNDGNPAGTVFIESTQESNSAGSNVVIKNTGDTAFKQWVSNVLTTLFQIVTGATPSIQIGANTSVEMADNAGVLGTILKIDSSGDTVFQQHPTGANFLFLDHTGATLYQIDSSGHPVVNNNTTFRANDNLGAGQPILKYDDSNNVVAFLGTSGQFSIQDNNAGHFIMNVINSSGINIQGADSAGAESNILGVDSSGNTFIQSHTTNNQVVVYDKHGAALVTVYANGDITHGTVFIPTPFHLTTSNVVNSGTTTTLVCTGGSTGVPTTATGVIIGGGVSSPTAGAFITLAPNGQTLGHYGGWTCQNASNQLEEFVMTIPLSGGKLDVHANAGNVTLQDWYITGYIV